MSVDERHRRGVGSSARNLLLRGRRCRARPKDSCHIRGWSWTCQSRAASAREVHGLHCAVGSREERIETPCVDDDLAQQHRHYYEAVTVLGCEDVNEGLAGRSPSAGAADDEGLGIRP